MATGTGQRVGIWIITIVMVVGTLGSFAVLIIGNRNQQTDKQAQQEQIKEFEAQQLAAATERAKNSLPFGDYEATTFDADSVKELNKSILVAGSGAAVGKTDTITISYFGWTPEGRIFDSTHQKGSDDTPTSLILSGLIPGWIEGLEGVEVGSTVKLRIPADKAYGATGSGIIEPNTPLKFIIKIDEAKKTEQTETQ